jgi:hypothetical protein
MAWYVDDLKDLSTVLNGETKSISKSFAIAAGDSPLLIDIKVSGGAAAGTLTFEDSSDGFTTINSKNTATVAGAGTYTLKLMPYTAADQTHYPLRKSGRVKLAATGDTTIVEVRVMVER